MKNILLEIIEMSEQNGLDPVAEIKNYLAEKDSHIRWHEAERLVERLTSRAVEENLPLCPP